MYSNLNVKQKQVQKDSNAIMPQVIFAIIVGVFIVISSPVLRDSSTSANIKFADSFDKYVSFIIFFVGCYIHVLFHETGHLLFGLMTGYSLISFRIGSLTIVRDGDKLKLKKFGIPGTSGQCLMMPPERKDGKYPFVLYNLGGILMNLTVSSICILSAFSMQVTSYPFNKVLLILGGCGIYSALLNGFPMRIRGVSNDGNNILLMLKNEAIKEGRYLDIKVLALQHSGTRLKSLPIELFKLKEGSDLTLPINITIKMLEYSWYLDNMDFENAKLCLSSMLPYLDVMLPSYKNDINCERVFMALISNCNKDYIDSLFDDNFRKFIRKWSHTLEIKRLLMTYHGFYNNDMEAALEYYRDAKYTALKHPIKADCEMELMLMEWIKESLEKRLESNVDACNITK